MGKVDKKAVARKPKEKKVVTKKPGKPRFIVKDIGGEKNGGKRKVLLKRKPKWYPTQQRSKRINSRRKMFSEHKHKLRSSITPGTVLILLGGRHKGKHVVFLKQLQTGLLMVTGPYHINGCPMRRINQIHVIATQTKLDISNVKVPDHVNDEYFRRKELKKPKQGEGEIFDTKKEAYTVSDQRKEDQLNVDKQVMDAIRKNPEKKLFCGYLASMFSLKNKQYPHKMIF